MIEPASIDFKIGQLAGQVTALVSSIQMLTDAMTRLEGKFEKVVEDLERRLDQNITDTTALKVKVSLFGLLAGAIGSVVVTLIQSFLIKKI
jgi:hypothetical protein